MCTRGLNTGRANTHGELDYVTTAYVDGVLRNGNRRLSTKRWLRGFDGSSTHTLGEIPEQFTHNGVSYPLESFTKSPALTRSDYVGFTSFTHHPFYEKFILEIPDNWRRCSDFNVSPDEMIAIIDNATQQWLRRGWGSDVSESGFIYKRDSRQSTKLLRNSLTRGTRALDMPASKQRACPEEINAPVAQKKITQGALPRGFLDRWQTTDDHGMLIVGIAKDQKGNKFYRRIAGTTRNIRRLLRCRRSSGGIKLPTSCIATQRSVG